MEKIKIFYYISFIVFLFPVKENDYIMPSGEKYIIGEDGIKRVYVNIWGHVKRPGTYLVYENIDITTALSIAGGPLQGADLSKIEIISRETNSITKLNIEDLVNFNTKNKYEIKPYDTIKVDPSTIFYLRNNAYLFNTLLQLLTLALAIDNNN